jgi:uncharacterized protein (TIGR03790 family)
VLCLLATLAPAPNAGAADNPPASRVVILANADQPESVALARYYAMRRAVPEANIVALRMPAAETISWDEFIATIWQPLQDELIRTRWIDAVPSTLRDAAGRKRIAAHGHRIAYLVVCRGAPLRIRHDPTRLPESAAATGPVQFRTNEAAVDSELALLAVDEPAVNGYMPNVLYRKSNPTPFELAQVVRVSRLDGPDDASARALVDRALEAERTGLIGRAYVDIGGAHPQGDAWLADVAGTLAGLGFETDVDRDPATLGQPARFDAPAFYFGWYTMALNGPMEPAEFRFPAGAVALHIHSFSAATLRSDREGWVGPMVRRGVTATVGNVFEPYLELTHDPRLLLAALRGGAPFGEAAASAVPALGWQAITVGDPLYRPFAVSLEEQSRQLARLSDMQAGHVVVRLARLLESGGRGADALTLLRRSHAERPSLALGLAVVDRLEQTGDRAGALAVLAGLEIGADLAPDQWGAWLAAARRLTALGGVDRARTILSRLLTQTGLPAELRNLLEQERARAGEVRN